MEKQENGKMERIKTVEVNNCLALFSCEETSEVKPFKPILSHTYKDGVVM